MALTLITSQATISKGDVNQIINVLQQPSGGQELSKYVLSGNVYVANGYISVYIPSLSRTSTPVSVAIDSVDVTKASYMNAPATNHLTAGGVQIYDQWTSANGGGGVGGNVTFNY